MGVAAVGANADGPPWTRVASTRPRPISELINVGTFSVKLDSPNPFPDRRSPIPGISFGNVSRVNTFVINGFPMIRISFGNVS
jgi:hypothetical protein